jgi:ABC-type Fe3+-siderophore transport system permease subunit
MTVLWMTLAASIALAGWLTLGLASYALFHPYVDTLKQKVALNVAALPALFGLFLPMLRSERPWMIPIYFVCFAILLAISTVLFHFVEQKYRHA